MSFSSFQVEKLSGDGLKMTEILYIFFGIHTAKVVLLVERLQERQLTEAA